MPILTVSGKLISRNAYYKKSKPKKSKSKKTNPTKPTRPRKPQRKAPITEAQATQILDDQLSRRLRTWI